MNLLRSVLVATAFAAFTLPTLTSCGDHDKATKPETAAGRTEEELSAEDLISNPNTANPQEVPLDNSLGVMTFTEKEYDFGDIHQGDVVKHTFLFTNTGKKPIIIDNASASCGCTVPTYSDKPIGPGEKGVIDVRFDSKGKTGQVSKVVTVRANTLPNINEVTIRANVLVP
jgi:Protein of unknown function (DUF1573)